MDASDTRRGRPATHRAFAERAPRRTAGRASPQQYGAAAAILLGDLLLSWADELLRRCGLPLDRVAAALDVFDLCRSEVIAGQFLDVSAQARGAADVDAAMTVLRYKSAKYSVERPLHIGAALGRRDAGAGRRAGRRSGCRSGEAFQLRDDLLGVFGDPATTGKPAGRRPGGGQAHRAGRAGAGRRTRPTRPPCSTPALGHPARRGGGGPAARDHRRLRRARPGRAGHRRARRRSPWRRWTARRIDERRPRRCCATWRPRPPIASADARARRAAISRGCRSPA